MSKHFHRYIRKSMGLDTDFFSTFVFFIQEDLKCLLMIRLELKLNKLMDMSHQFKKKSLICEK